MEHNALRVFYNGSCPICRVEVEHYQRAANAASIENLKWSDIYESPNALSSYGLSKRDATIRLHSLSEAGTLITGVDSFIAIWQRLPRYRWLAAVASLPIFKPVFRWGYDNLAVPILLWINREKN